MSENFVIVCLRERNDCDGDNFESSPASIIISKQLQLFFSQSPHVFS